VKSDVYAGVPTILHREFPEVPELKLVWEKRFHVEHRRRSAAYAQDGQTNDSNGSNR
jgi:hypothetical protein